MKQNRKQKVDNIQSTPAIAKLPVVCRLFGHKEAEMTDGGYPYCKRCGSHSYYDDMRCGEISNRWVDAGILMKPIWWMQRIFFQLKCDLKYWYNRTFRGDELPF